MTAIDKVKKRLWMSQYKVTDVTDIRFIQAYDLIVENIYRVAVRKIPGAVLLPVGDQVDVLVIVKKGVVTFYKEPHLDEDGKLVGTVVDTSPVKIFIKHGKQYNNTSVTARRKGNGNAKSSPRDRSQK